MADPPPVDSDICGAGAGGETEKPTPYDPSFTEEDALIILQSSDGTLYRMHAFVLRKTSEFFSGMMTLPQKSQNPAEETEEHIVLNETSKILGVLLRMISGLEIPKWVSIDDVEDVLAAAHKYDMDGPIATIRSAMYSPLFVSEPLKLYAIAANNNWEEEAKEASKLSLALWIHDEKHVLTLERVPSPYLIRLFDLHWRRQDGFKLPFNKKPCFGSNNTDCHNCGRRQNWEPLVLKFFVEMEKRPDGDTLVKWKQWDEAKLFFSGERCNDKHRCSTYTDYDSIITSFIQVTLKHLPLTI